MINDQIPLKTGYSLALGGWGDIEPETVGIQNSRDPEFLQYTIQEFITLEECNKTITELQKKYPKENEMPLAEGKLCTLPPKYTSACHGDSGSGLIVTPVSILKFLFISTNFMIRDVKNTTYPFFEFFLDVK